MSFGESFSQSYLGAQQQAQQAAIEAWRQQHEQKMMDLQQQLQQYNADPNSPHNLYYAAQAEEAKKRGDYYSGMDDTRKKQEEDTARDKATQRFNTAMGPKGPGVTFGQALPMLPPDLQQQIIGQGVAQGNQANMLQALQQSPASFLSPDAGAPSMGGPMLGAPPAGSFLPPDQAGPTLPPLPAATQDVQPGMAGMRMMEPPGASASPFSQDQFLNSQSPAFLQEQARQQNMMANRQNMMDNRDAVTGIRQQNADTAAARQKLSERLLNLREPILKATAEKLATENDYLPDTLQAKLDNYQRIQDLTDFNEGIAKARLGLAQQSGDLAAKRFVQDQGNKAYSMLLGARQAALAADKAVDGDRAQLAGLKAQRDRVMGAADYKDRTDLQKVAQDIQDKAQAIQDQLVTHLQAKNVNDQMKHEVEQSLRKAGINVGSGQTTAPGNSRPAPPKMDLNALKLKYGVG